jgi:hypothetical protein
MSNNVVLFLDSNGNTFSYDLLGNGVFDIIPNIVVPGNLVCNNLHANTLSVNVVSTNTISVNTISTNNITVTQNTTTNVATVTSNTLTLGTSSIIAANGYAWLPNGLLMQWGQYVSGSGYFNYPIPFQSNALIVITSVYTAPDGGFSQIVNSSVFQQLSTQSDTLAYFFAIGH